jgi:hypothetical protein
VTVEVALDDVPVTYRIEDAAFAAAVDATPADELVVGIRRGPDGLAVLTIDSGDVVALSEQVDVAKVVGSGASV